MNTVETLKAMRTLLTPSGAWTQGTMARDESGEPTACPSPNARCWCFYGAWVQVRECVSAVSLVGSDWQQLSLKANVALISWNDQPGRTQAEVLTMIDKLIEATE